MIAFMAYQIFPLQNARYEIRCAPGDIVHVVWDLRNDTWAVEEDPEHLTYRNRSDAIDRARLVGKDPDYH